MIRRAEIKDIKAIEGLLLEVLAVHNAGRPDIFKPVGQKYTKEELREILLDDENPVFVYEDEKASVVAHCFCQVKNRPETSSTHPLKNLYIDDLCVTASARGTGVGRALYEYAKDYAKKIGCHNVTLHAWECNPDAVGFYRHLGMHVMQYTMEEIL